MARIISKPSSDFFNISYGKSIRASTFRTSVANQPLNGLPFKQSLKFRVSCSIKETERKNAAETQRIVSGLEVNGQLKEKDGLGEFGSGGGGGKWALTGNGRYGRIFLKDISSLGLLLWPLLFAIWIRMYLTPRMCKCVKVNLSVAIIPMSHQFGWNASVAGLVQSSFFWGYALSQLPGGWLAKVFGGRKVLEVGVLVWSLATALVPLLAGFMPGLIFSRILVGIGEGVSPSAATDMIARSIPIEERSRAVAFVFGGLSVGSVLGLLLAPPLIQNYGWGSVFYIFGSLGLAWPYKLPQIFPPKADVGRCCNSPQYVRWPQSNPMSKSWGSSLKELSSSLGGITNTVGARPGIIGVALTGYLLDTTHSWAMSLFAPSIFFYLTGTIVWLALASSKPQTFSKTDQ
ncbi:UNVERIFIED_CONTAM: putative anion transporter 6, chloroplastic [Sesamum calycinum]|uniref:Anion transporter 6, chloroplastic n=1 Tax=Sesamum calycinum TaxID=2727403 RepID=A0AAW2N2U0_9LAMI